MYFLDNSAHIFKLPDYNKKPIGYEFDEQDYIFWFEDQNENTRLSINNYYGKIINVLFEINNVNDINNTSISSLYDIEITCDSENFKLVKAIDFQNAINKQQSILDYIDINNQSKRLSSTNENDILIIKVNQDGKNYILIPIYIIGTSKYTGTWLTNILIDISNKFENNHTYCPITIGGIFNDEYEALVIHGRNMGINLPKEILKAINGTSLNNDVFDEELYNKKIKEYLLNYMNIKGELGNYESAIDSLNWFGYKDSIELYKLLETDNEFQNQYVRDYFNISQDIIQAFSYFLNSQFVGLKYKLNTETGELDKQNVDNLMWGEGLPLLTDNDSKYNMKWTHEFLDENTGDDNQRFKYISPYLNYSLYDLMFKLSYLKYYYQTYFLPIFIILKNLYIEYKVYATPTKYLSYTHDHICENIINTQEGNDVIFDTEHIRYFTHQKHFVDEYFNEFGELKETNNYNVIENDYIINDTCLYIPINFTSNKGYNCILILKDEDLNKIIYKSNFSFINSENNQYLGFVFYPKMINELYDKLYTYVNKNYVLYICANNVWYEYKFISKIHELDVRIGTLKYKYWMNDLNYIYNKYHEYKSNDNELKAVFTIYNDENHIKDINLDITDYIIDRDFFDNPSKYFSNFPQINTISNREVKFNIFMNDPDFIYLNDINFGLWEKTQYDINELINRHKSQINLIHNYKYLNNVHMYYLYSQVNDINTNYNILHYKQNLSILCNDILVKKSYTSNEFTFTKVSNANNNTNTINDNYNYYLNGHSNNNELSLSQNQAYYFILERNINGLTGRNTTDLYSYYNDVNNINEIGFIICPITINSDISLNNDDLHNGVYDYQLNTGYNIDNIIVEDNDIYYINNGYKYNVSFEFVPLIKDTSNNIALDKIILNKYTLYDSSTYQLTQNTQIYGQLKLFYYPKIKVLNLYGYYNPEYCTNFDEDNMTCSVTIIDQTIDNVKLYMAANLVQYMDIKNNSVPINADNPSLYWTSLDENDNIIDSDINTINNIGMNHSEEDLINEMPMFINYLCKDLTGYKGTYYLKIDSENELNNYIQLVVEVYSTSNLQTPKNRYINNTEFTLTGNEGKVICYIRFNQHFSGTYTCTLGIYPSKIIESEIKYTGNENLYTWYQKFFYKKYEISLRNKFGIRKYNKEMWDSYIKFDENDNYDTYLMHGKNSIDDPNEYWYFMFISKNTCDDLTIANTLNNYPETIQFGEYILKHISTKQLFLINRMNVDYVDNIYHFNGNEMIVCSLYNNKMLPTNMNIKSKWELKPISFGANTNNIIYANTNTAIISIPNSNAYDKGYYNLQVNYSLDGNIMNYQTINKKILIQ